MNKPGKKTVLFIFYIFSFIFPCIAADSDKKTNSDLPNISESQMKQSLTRLQPENLVKDLLEYSSIELPPMLLGDENPDSVNASPSAEISSETILFDESNGTESQGLQKDFWNTMEIRQILGSEISEESAEDAEKKEAKSITLEGTIVPEEIYLKSRKFLRRWAVETKDGERYQLSSNLILLAAVKQQENLNGPVQITGKWIDSPGTENLKFVKVESIHPSIPSDEPDDKPQPNGTSIASNTTNTATASSTKVANNENELIASSTDNISSSTDKISSPTNEITENTDETSNVAEDKAKGENSENDSDNNSNDSTQSQPKSKSVSEIEKNIPENASDSKELLSKVSTESFSVKQLKQNQGEE
ncbi:MAG: hypothetical protein HQM10_03390 [Candidatus Riflebacteria bacterium]|nr:hypothetical protein [Candidatus Riflebacteria bacterium]